MLIIETAVFTRRVEKVLDEESYRLLQLELAQRPDLGEVIRGTGGLRKVRWVGKGRGKRGGARIIYYWIAERGTLLMLLIYEKTEQEDLTSEQRRTLRRLVEEELR